MSGDEEGKFGIFWRDRQILHWIILVAIILTWVLKYVY